MVCIFVSMRFLNEAPFVRLIVPCIAGILAAVYFLHNETIIITCACFSIALMVVLLSIKSHSTAFRYSWLNGLTINVALFFLSAQLTLCHTEIRFKNHFSKIAITGTTVVAKLSDPPVEKSKTFKCKVRIKNCSIGKVSVNTKGNAIVYIKKDSLSKMLKYGDVIAFCAGFKEIPPPQNPGEFDYKQYLSFHNIHQQQFIAQHQWLNLHINAGNHLMRFVYSLRNNLLCKLKEHGLLNDEYAVVAALLLGYDDEISAELMGAYAATGTLHVLSVSGLHVGLVYLAFHFLLIFLERFKNGKIIKGLLIIMLLWGYAALTGLSPAVMRATTMFSFIVIGQSIKRTTNIYNTLAASCLILLLFNPYLIFEVGFQLSYLAVLGIVFLQPLIYNSWSTNKWFWDQIWKITTVSIAAQLATFPLSVFYFHQFPNYFLLSNLMIIPVATLVIYNGILLFVLGSIPYLGVLLGKMLNYQLLFLNSSVTFLEHLPYALYTAISISIIEILLIYSLIIFIVLFFLKHKASTLFAGLSVVILLLSINLYKHVVNLRQQKIIVYNLPSASAIDIIQGTKNYFIADSVVSNSKSNLQFYIKNNWCNLGLKETIPITDNLIKIVKVGTKTLVRITKKEQLLQLPPIKVDYLVLSNNCNVNIAELNASTNFNLLVLDSGNSFLYAAQCISVCEKLNKKYYNVLTSGAFVENI